MGKNTTPAAAAASGSAHVASEERKPRSAGFSLVRGIIMLLSLVILISLSLVFTLATHGYVAQIAKPFLANLGLKDEKIPFFVVFAEFVLVFATSAPALIFLSFFHGYNNDYPRYQKGSLTGFPARLYSAHLNLQESFPSFAIAVIVATLSKVPLQLRVSLTLLHIAARCVYQVVYSLNLSTLRSFVYFVAWHSVALLFCLSLFPSTESFMTGAFQQIFAHAQDLWVHGQLLLAQYTQ